MNSVGENQVCVGCGICKAVCPKACISMQYGQNGEYTPDIDDTRCIECGTCLKYCTMALESQNQKRKLLAECANKYMYGLEDGRYFLGVVRDEEQVMKSASGGFVTAFAKKLLNEKQIDGVINAECVSAYKGQEHFRACLCRTEDDIERTRSSVYGPVNFDTILSQIKGCSERLLIIGVPCVIWGMKKLFLNDPMFSGNTIITLALACSHNVNGRFTDFMADYYGMSDKRFKINYRAKDKLQPNQSNFLISLTDEDGVEIRQNRYKSIWTEIWRRYYFALSACEHCTDFWGKDADISVKDAWGIGNKYRYGSNMIISRNTALSDVILSMTDFQAEELNIDRVAHAQDSSVVHKQAEFEERLATGKGSFLPVIYESKRIYEEKGMDGILELVKGKA